MRAQQPTAEETTGPISRVSAQQRSSRTLVKILALVAVALVSGVLWWVVNGTGSSDRPRSSNHSGHPGSAPQQRFQRVGGPVDNSGCAGHSYGTVQRFFGHNECVRLHQVLYTSHTARGKVLSSVSAVTMPKPKQAATLQRMIDSDDTGNVTDLVTAGVRLPGGPDTVKGGGYASQLRGAKLVIAESGFFDGKHDDGKPGDKHSGEALLTKVSRAALSTG